MKERWLRLSAKVNALSQRERMLVSAMLAAALYLVFHFAVLGPVERKQAALRAQVAQQQDNIAGIDAEIAQKVAAYQVDPDAAARARLAEVKAESARLGDSLRAMQQGLVAPERMGALLDSILRGNGRLQLVSMKTLPVGSLADMAAARPAAPQSEERKVLASITSAAGIAPAAAGAAPAAANGKKGADLLYRHGVEIALRGSYLDIVSYMSALEAMPNQLFWSRAQLDVEEYPTARLTLTLYTLSLDPKWMKL